MADLRTKFCGLGLANPFVVAASPATETLENIIKCAEHGAGAVITKSIGLTSEPRGDNDVRRVRYQPTFGMWMLSTFRREILALEEGLRLVSNASTATSIPIIASVCVSNTDPNEWARVCSALADVGASMVQLDLYYFPRPMHLPEHQRMLAKVIRKVSSNLKVPLMIKLSSDISPDVVAQILDVVPIDAVCYLDSVRLANPISIEDRGMPSYHFVKHAGPCSLAGPWIRPLTMYYTQELSRLVPLPLCACGGLSTSEDAIEALMRGATVISAATGILVNGFGFIQTIVAGIADFLDRRQFHSVDAIRGLACQHGQCIDQSVFLPAVAEIDQDICSQCGDCVRLVFCDAVERGGKIHVRQQACEGCGLCVDICPVGAIRLVAT